VGKFQYLEDELSEVYEDTVLNTLADLLEASVAALDSIAVLEEALQSATGQDSLDILDRRTEALDSLTAITIRAASKDSLTLLGRSVAADDLVDWNNDITDTLQFISNERVIHDVFLNTVLVGERGLTSTQKGNLEDIAGQCPFIGGNAVFRARALLAAYIGQAYYSDDSLYIVTESLISPPQALRKSLGELQGITLYPNPADNSVTLLAKEIFLDPGHISLYDLTGRLLKQVVLASGQRQWNIDVADLSPGLYLYRITKDNRNYASGKLSIIR